MLFKQELIVLLSAAAPISEVRGAIPLAVFLFGFHPAKAFALGVLGNLLPILPLLVFLEHFSDFLMRRSYFFNRFLTWLFEYTRKNHADHFHYWGWAPLALFIFVAIPLPLTGGWSGALAAFIFGIPLWRAFSTISLGVFTAGLIVLALTLLGVYTFT